MTLRILYDEAMLSHESGDETVERPARLTATVEELARASLHADWRTPREAPPDDLLARMHDPAHLERLLASRGRYTRFDWDTATGPTTQAAAWRAAGAAVDAVDALIDGEADAALALVRPPGHHAERGQAMGFCFLNNVALAAAHARARGCERVLIVDWDVHHGNGTQHLFEDRDDVLFFSTHRFPFYPGTGAADEVGRGAGTGFTVNVPMTAGLGDGDHAAVFDRILVPIADSWRPDLVLVSAGFDAHADDPLGDQVMTEDGFARLCATVQGIARRHAGGRIALLLEGGYDLGGLARSVRACAEVLEGAEAPDVGLAGAAGLRCVERAIEVQRRHWSALT